MPNGEIISNGKTLGYTGDFEKALALEIELPFDIKVEMKEAVGKHIIKP